MMMMRDRSTWQAGLADELEPHLEGLKPRLACATPSWAST
jgi:hypothetical protein